jgi:protein-S-isoprenylcysteine O-methyltransferase
VGLIFGASEVLLAIAKRRGSRNAAADAGSLRLIWITVALSLTAALLVAGAFPEGRFRDVELMRAVGIAIFVVGAALRWYAIFYLGAYFTVDVRVAESQRVIDTGPYRFVRHPSYTGVLLEFLGFALCIGNAWSMLLLIPLVIVFLYRIRVEERALQQGLGEAYASYQRRTKRLIPFVY